MAGDNKTGTELVGRPEEAGLTPQEKGALSAFRVSGQAPVSPAERCDLQVEEARAKKRAYYRRNQEKEKERARVWREQNPEKTKNNKKKCRAKFKEKNAIAMHQWRTKNKEKIKAYDKKLITEGKCLHHPNINSVSVGKCYACRLKSNLRSRFSAAIKAGSKAGSAVRDLGCTIPEFRSYIEALWAPGMSWSNWGKGPGTWQIDHRRPLASFDLTQREQVKEACLFINLQPLWKEENARKGARDGN